MERHSVVVFYTDRIDELSVNPVCDHYLDDGKVFSALYDAKDNPSFLGYVVYEDGIPWLSDFIEDSTWIRLNRAIYPVLK